MICPSVQLSGNRARIIGHPAFSFALDYYLGCQPVAGNDCLGMDPHVDEPLRLPDQLGGQHRHAGRPVTDLLVLR